MENFGNLYKTQEGTILGHMLIHGSITEREAFRKYNITCTAQRIYDLRKLGFCIRTEKIFFQNRYGHTSYYGRGAAGGGRSGDRRGAFRSGAAERADDGKGERYGRPGPRI